MKETMDSNTSTRALEPALWAPHPHFSDAVNRNIIESEIEGGVHLRDLAPGSVLSVALISGHPEFCPEPAEVRIHGSTWGGSMIKEKFVGRGMRLEFSHPVQGIILTSRIIDICAET